MAARHRLFEAIDLLYRIRRRNPREPDAHSQYFQFFALRSNEVDARFSPQVANTGCWVQVKLSDGSQDSFVIEDLPRAELKIGERDLHDDLVRLLVGKVSGETFDVRKTSLQHVTGTVVELKSKYVHAFQECGKQFSVAFPLDERIIQMTVPTKLTSIDDLPTEFHRLMELKARQSIYAQDVLKLYRDRRITIGNVAELLHINPFEAMGFLITEGTGIYCSRGIRSEVEAALRNSMSSKPLIVDLSTIFTWRVLDLQDIFEKMFAGRLFVGQTTVDTIASLHHERTMGGARERMQISKQDNVYYREVVTVDRLKDDLEYLTETLNWVRAKFQVKPRKSVISKDAAQIKKLDELLGREFSECLHIAKECDGLLVSEDEHLRGLARSEVSVEGVWTRVLLDLALVRGVLPKEQYCQKVVELIEMRYGFIEFGADIVVAAMKKEEFRVTKKLEETTKLLRGSFSEVGGAIHTVIECLFLFWKESLVPVNETTLTAHLLDNLVVERDFGKTIDSVMQGIAKKFKLLPLEAKRWLDFVDRWSLTQSIHR